jgi:hypothetical protein
MMTSLDSTDAEHEAALFSDFAPEVPSGVSVDFTAQSTPLASARAEPERFDPSLSFIDATTLAFAEPHARLQVKSQTVQEAGALARSFPQPELRRYLRKDPIAGIVLRSCLEEMETVLDESSTPFVIRSGIRVDSDEWITGGGQRTRYILTVHAPNLTVEERLGVWRKLSQVLPSGKKKALSQLAKPPRIHGVDIWDNVIVHFDLQD